jgi:hypothetical protein
MIKWKLMITTLPYVIGVLFLKYLVSDVFGYHGIIEFSDVALVLTGGIFLIGFMLAGTMADYKESEKLPGELSCTLESIEDTVKIVLQNYPDLQSSNLKNSFYTLSASMYDWLYKKIEIEQVYTYMNLLIQDAAAVEKAGAGGFASRIIGEVSSLRRVVTRIHVISTTDFLAPGYALLETLITCVVAILFIAKFKSTLAEVVIVTFVTLIYVYMYRLIRDIDDPFEYEEGKVGSAEVDIFPLTDYIKRANKIQE